MSKKNKSSQFPASQPKPNIPNQAVVTTSNNSTTPNNQSSHQVKPEHNSLLAFDHIQKYLKSIEQSDMSQDDLNAVLRLSTHLRIFGLLSAVAYVNQKNAQDGKVRKRTVPVWSSLLGSLLNKPTDYKNGESRRELMEIVADIAKKQPTEYMAKWRESIVLAEQWNFWARAYTKQESTGEDTNNE
jgi:hypothetical protein